MRQADGREAKGASTTSLRSRLTRLYRLPFFFHAS